ncbi:MAG: SufD family Fe-S cluster assembly protein, partial [Steroidobacteraceae bacterium]|nr:SufD family Fe-S cluster assembly protein [Steroidobacteraceae bacterium]MDW8260136.1 SufD family Fe-S cluster assembly protein [Gammaproteobacteria bacterium]
MNETLHESLPGTPPRDGARGAALARWRERGLPEPRDEFWRYAPLAGLERLKLTPPPSGAQPAQNEHRGSACIALPNFEWLNVRDGALPALPPTWSTEPAELPHDADPLVDALIGNGFALLNAAYAPEVATLQVPAASSVRWQVVYSNTTAGELGTVPTALRIVLGPGSRAEIVEYHEGMSGMGSIGNHRVLIDVGRDAELRLTRVLAPGCDARHFETLELTLHAGAGCVSRTVFVGNTAARSTVYAALRDAGAALDFATVMLGDATQRLDQHVLIDHIGAATRSREVFRGLAAGRAQLGFTGHNRIQSTARGSR